MGATQNSCLSLVWAYWLISARNIKSGQNRWNRFIGVRVAVMTELFPDAYPDYMSHSKMLIPFVL